MFRNIVLKILSRRRHQTQRFGFVIACFELLQIVNTSNYSASANSCTRFITSTFAVISVFILYFPENIPRYPMDRRLGEPYSQSGRYGDGKILDPKGTSTPNPR